MRQNSIGRVEYSKLSDGKPEAYAIVKQTVVDVLSEYAAGIDRNLQPA